MNDIKYCLQTENVPFQYQREDEMSNEDREQKKQEEEKNQQRD